VVEHQIYRHSVFVGIVDRAKRFFHISQGIESNSRTRKLWLLQIFHHVTLIEIEAEEYHVDVWIWNDGCFVILRQLRSVFTAARSPVRGHVEQEIFGQPAIRIGERLYLATGVHGDQLLFEEVRQIQ
jgi:hypothetical protein